MSKKIKLLVEVDEENYQLIKGMADVAGMSFCEILRNGTPITEGDLISRSELKSHKFLSPQVKVVGGRHNGKTKEQIVEAYQKGWNDCIDAITDNAPTVDAIVNTIEVRPQGEWINSGVDISGHRLNRCSICNGVYQMSYVGDSIIRWNYCPNCGADMRGDAE